MSQIEELTLEPLPPAESLFCATVPTLPQVWDSTMLGLLKECPRKFKYIIIDGWQSRSFSSHLMFGLAYHSVLEHYDKDISQGFSHEEALANATLFAMNYGTRDEAGNFVPYDRHFTNEPTKTRETLLRTTIWYLDHFAKDPLKTVQLASGKPAVELSFKLNLDLFSPDGQPFLLAGHLDRLVEQDGAFYFLDRKTTKGALDIRYWKQYTPHNQMSLYDFATQHILAGKSLGGIIDAAQIGVNFSRFSRLPVHRTPGQRLEWLKETYYWLGLATTFATDEHWPMNEKSCSNFGGCEFRDICAKDPKVREKFLASGPFTKRQWNPLESR